MAPPSDRAADLPPTLDRRRLLLGAGSVIAWAHIPKYAYASGRDPRLVVIVLRGALDGLAAVPPVGDPGYAGLREKLAIGTPGLDAVLQLDSMFSLNGAMPGLHALYQAKELLVVHATATPYRERSHFDGQDVLEAGVMAPRTLRTGWLNRAAAALPAGEPIARQGGLATSPTVPLILRGSAPVLTWIPPNLPQAASDTAARLMDLYVHRDPQMAKVFQAGTRSDAIASGMTSAADRAGGGRFRAFHELGLGAARLMAKDDGPRVAVISLDGWDTHAGEGAGHGRLAKLLGALDGMIGTVRQELGAHWRETVVVAVTEFGRTARENGTAGTDHGTATTAFLAGGAVKGGRVVADWPGLKPRQLYQQRDLAPTTDLRAVLKGVLRDHLGIAERELARSVFPDSIAVRPLGGLVA
jgi:uncharacterized protein (DUF1501 family)